MGLQLTTPLILLVLSICSSTSSYADLTTFVYKGCANQKFQDRYGISSQNLKSLYSNLISQSSTTNFYNTTTENAQLTTSITGVYQCRGDLSNSDCNTCIKKIPERIEKVCGGDTIATRVHLDGCYMRYEVVGFPTASATELLYKQCASNRASGSRFDERLESALVQVATVEALRHSATTPRETVEICFDFFSSVVCRKETERIGFRFSDAGCCV